jgi:hypothetical protein
LSSAAFRGGPAKADDKNRSSAPQVCPTAEWTHTCDSHGDHMPQNHDLKSLDELIATLGGADTGAQTPGPSGLLLEHLQAARRDLLGSITGEYRFSLEQAKESVASILDKSARSEMKRRLQSLIDLAADRISSADRARSVA